MKYKSLLFCLSILVMVFAGCSPRSSSLSPEELAKLVAEQVQAAEDARLAAEQHRTAQKALDDAEKTLASIRQQAKSIQDAKAAEDARLAEERVRVATEDARLAKERARIAAEQQAAQAKAIEDARLAEERARVAAEQQAAQDRVSRTDRQQRKQAATAAQTTTLALETPIEVITTSEISTKTGKTGDVFTAVLNEDIADGGRVIARRGSTVKGMISESDPGGRVKGVATISLTLTRLTLADGSEISVSTDEYYVEAQSSVGKNVAKTGIGAGIGAAVGAIAGGARGAAIGAGVGGAAGAGTALATRGNAAVVTSETEITFHLTSPVTITMNQDSGRRQ